MKRWLSVILITLSLAIGVWAWTQQATDAFFPCTAGQGHSGENITTATGNWTMSGTGILGCVGDAGGTVNANTNNTDKLHAIYYYSNAVSFLTDQYASVTLPSVPGDGNNQGLGVAVRVQAGSENCYFLEYFNAAGTKTAKLGVVNSGTVTYLQSTSVTYSAGVKLRLEVTGIGSATRLTGYADTGSGFVAITNMTTVDPGGTYIDGGKPGMYSEGTNSAGGLDDWFGGDQAAATPTPAPGTGGGASGFFIYP